MNADQKKLILDAWGRELIWSEFPPTEIGRLLALALCKSIPSKDILPRAIEIKTGTQLKESEIRGWMESVRERLGMPKPKPGKRSAEHREALRKWWEANGSPSPEQIMDGYFDEKLSAHPIANPDGSEPTKESTAQPAEDGHVHAGRSEEALRADGWVKLGVGEKIFVRQVSSSGKEAAAGIIDVWCGSSNPAEGNGRWIRQVFTTFNPDSMPIPPNHESHS
jgi:hypothetical protein